VKNSVLKQLRKHEDCDDEDDTDEEESENEIDEEDENNTIKEIRPILENFKQWRILRLIYRNVV
jgi:hypothetical protein